MRIGIDFDNTIADYDEVFSSAATAEGLLSDGFSGGKDDVKQAVIGTAGEEAWMRLQGRVYGAHMKHAKLFKGVTAFLDRCRDQQARVFIVSHKTRHGHFDEEKVDLHTAAMDWMENQNLFSGEPPAVFRDDVIFEPSREEKIARIRDLGCTHFIDDLPEVFSEPAFPGGVKRYLFLGRRAIVRPGPFGRYRRWTDIRNEIFDQ